MEKLIQYIMDKNFLRLKKIHFKRLKKKNISISEIEFLKNHYLKSSDIRFFNELLFVSKDPLDSNILNHFENNLNENKTYKFCYENKLKKFLSLKPTTLMIDKTKIINHEICLIGTPIFFIAPFFNLKKFCKNIDIINIIGKPTLTNNFITSFLYKFIFKNNYTEIKVRNKQDINNLTLNKKYDIGFHKLNFIIKDELISCFSLGLINDHWAPLPLFKGRSSIYWSKLFGSQLLYTNHLINSEIDQGKIILYSKMNPSFYSKYISLKSRIINSIIHLSNENFYKYDNKLGILFFEMHDFICKHIEKNKI